MKTTTIQTMTADELRETLRAAGYTQAEFARELDRSESFVSNLVRGLTPMQLRYIQALRRMMGEDVFDASIRSARRCIVKGECDRATSRLSRRVTGGVRVRVTLSGEEDDEGEQPRTRRAHPLSDDVIVSHPDDEDIQDTLDDDDDDTTLEDDELEDDDGSDDEDDASDENEEYDDDNSLEDDELEDDDGDDSEEDEDDTSDDDDSYDEDDDSEEDDEYDDEEYDDDEDR